MITLSKRFYLTSAAIALLGAMGISVRFAIRSQQGDPNAATDLSYVGIPMLLLAVVFLVLTYRMWRSIQGGPARMSPGKAVGFLFIPVFNVYWFFQVLWGFSIDYNRYVASRALGVRTLPQGLFLTYCILSLTTWIPAIGVFTGLATAVLMFILISRICDAVNALSQAASVESALGHDAPVSADQQRPARCPHCEEPLQAEDEFCGGCGKPVVSPVPVLSRSSSETVDSKLVKRRGIRWGLVVTAVLLIGAMLGVGLLWRSGTLPGRFGTSIFSKSATAAAYQPSGPIIQIPPSVLLRGNQEGGSAEVPRKVSAEDVARVQQDLSRRPQ